MPRLMPICFNMFCRGCLALTAVIRIKRVHISLKKSLKRGVVGLGLGLVVVGLNGGKAGRDDEGEIGCTGDDAEVCRAEVDVGCDGGNGEAIGVGEAGESGKSASNGNNGTTLRGHKGDGGWSNGMGLVTLGLQSFLDDP